MSRKRCVLLMFFFMLSIGSAFASCPFLYNINNFNNLSVDVCSDNKKLYVEEGSADYCGNNLSWSDCYNIIPTLSELEIAYIGVTCDSTVYITTTNILDQSYTSCNAMIGILTKYNGQYVVQKFCGAIR